ncbi:MAG TPA: hypothetical protein VGO22_05605 [Pseudorhizobium sp.]|nr:hypothetical protein [Pseudorhizobium sp.]
MTGFTYNVSRGLFLLLALGCWSSRGSAMETVARWPQEQVSPIAKAYRELGDLYRNGRLPPGELRDVEQFLAEVRRASTGAVTVAVVDPTKLVERGGAANPDGPRAVSAYQVAGGLGDPEALVRLGELYREGSVVPKDLNAAFSYFSKARDLGYQSARWRLADMMLRGEGTAIDRQAAHVELKAAADAGVATAMLMLGDLYASGDLGSADASAAISTWQQAVDAGEVRGLSRLAALYDNGKIVHRDAERAYRLFDEAGAKGDTHAAVRAARMLLAGDGVPADRARAVARLKALGNTAGAEGKVALADFYSDRKQSAESFDLRRAYELYTHAAEQGSRSAKLRTAVMQIHGQGTAARPETGIAMLQAMASEGYAPAAYSLGDLFAFGPSHLANPRAAIAAYEQAHTLGDLRATVLLGDIFSSGTLVPREPEKALKYYQTAALRDDLAARLKANELMIRDTGTQEEARAAFEDIRRIATGGLTDAVVLFADLTRTGIMGVAAADEGAALRSYVAAAEKGNKEAALRAGEIFIAGTPRHRDPARGVALMLAIAKSDPSAFLSLGDALLKIDASQSETLITPLEAFERAGAAGIPAAYLRLGDLYRDGIGVSVDGTKAARYYLQAAGLHAPGDQSDGL